MKALISSSTVAWLGDVTLQASLVLGIALIGTLGVWRFSAAKRHTLLALSLCSLPLLLLGALQTPRWNWQKAKPELLTTAWHTRVTLSADPATPTDTKRESNATAPVAYASMNAVLIVWLLGVAFMAGRLAVSMLRLRRIRLGCEVFVDRRAAGLTKGHEAVELLASEETIMPMTWGTRRPVIVLPASATEWSDERMRVVIEHELAHVARRDAMIHLLCSLAACVLWFHPLVWIAQRRLAHLRETACDDHVLRAATQSPADYAEQLLQAITDLRVEGRVTAFAPALAIGIASMAARELKARLASILDEDTDRTAFSVRRRWLVSLGFVGAAVLVSGLSACREAPKAAASGHEVAADDSRIYFLSDDQFRRLTDRANDTPPSQAPADPFAPKPAPNAAPMKSAEQMLQLAMRIRTRLLEEGITFQPNDKGEALVMSDERAMRVWADEANQAKITALLNCGGPVPKMVRINTFVFEVPVTPEHLKFFVDESSSGGFAMRGVLTQDQGKALLDKVRADKEIKLMAAPTVTAKSGQRAIVEVVREFMYPTEFDPPSVPPPDKLTGKAFPVTPTTPTAFEMRPVGLRMELKAELADSTDAIDLELTPEITTFDGFINYGSPIKEKSEDITGRPVELTLTENRIPQPVFCTNKITTAVVVNDGSYVILGGSANEPATNTDPLKAAQAKNDVDLKKLPHWGSSKSAVFFLIQASRINEEGK